MYCRYCGNELSESDKICKNCKIEVDFNDINEMEMETHVSNNSSKTRTGARLMLAILVVIVVGIVIMFLDSSTEDNQNDVHENNDNYISDDKDEGYIGSDSNWIDEYIEDVDNKNGNSLANLYNSGWVAEHGEWTYIAVRGHILKENIITGEKVQVYDFGNEDVEITALSVIGEYVYFMHEEYGLCRTKTNGTEFQYLRDVINVKWARTDLVARIYDGWYYYIETENITASTYEYYLEKVNLDDGTVERIFKAKDGLNIIGVRDDYVFFKEGDGKYHRVDLRDNSLSTCRIDEDFNNISEPYVADDEIIVFARNYNESIHAYVTEFENEEMNILFVGDGGSVGGNVNFIDNKIVYVESEYNVYHDTGWIMLMELYGNKTQVVPDVPDDNSLCVANGKIYYRYNGDSYRVNADGTGFEEINVDEYHYLYN